MEEVHVSKELTLLDCEKLLTFGNENIILQGILSTRIQKGPNATAVVVILVETNLKKLSRDVEI